MEKIRVMIIDDSAVMRQYLATALGKYSEIEVVGTAMDPYIAAGKISRLNPDVVTLDIEMPRMDGLTFLSKLMIANPLPVIMVSSLTKNGATETVKALQLGAVDFVCKPEPGDPAVMKAFSDELVEKIRAIKKVKLKRKPPEKQMIIEQKYSADVIIQKKDPSYLKVRTEKVIALGASTGGTEVIDEILVNLSQNVPGILITQHMPEHFTAAFANRVNGKSPLTVKEAAHGDRVYKGMAFIAPGGKHMLLNHDKDGYWIEINDGPPVNRHKPSVDVLFRSVSQSAGASASGIICTGMGSDGAKGLLEMKEAGCFTIAQDENSCVVYGMPNEAVKLGAAHEERNIIGIINYILGMG